MNEAAPLLSVEHLTMRFGGLVAIDDLSFDTADGEITAIIGPNGAGKSTLCLVLSQILPVDEGSVTVRGKVSQLVSLNTGMQGDLSGRTNVKRTRYWAFGSNSEYAKETLSFRRW